MNPKGIVIGDTVVIRGVVTGLNAANFTIANGNRGLYLSYSRDYEIIRKPWEPEPGDHIRHDLSSDGYCIYWGTFEDKPIISYSYSPDSKFISKWDISHFKAAK